MLGGYRIERLLGEGAMGEVFLATHVALGRPVAIKTLKPEVAADRSLTERFFAEARAVNIIRHENIVECTDLVHDPSGRSYIVMELLEGRTLGAAIRDAQRIPPRRAARIGAQIAEAIGAAHDKGIVHRDLKPENIYLIKRAGSSDYVKVLDFGIARLRPELGGVSATQSGALIGTPAYMSPEQVRGERVGPAADIYALGVILFHMLAGRLPFNESSLSMMLVAQLQETAPRIDKLVTEVPRPLADLVARALSKDADARPRTMAELRTALLVAVGLPVESLGSMIDSSPSIRLPAAGSLDPTLAPGVGQSSISAAAGEVARGPARSRALGWIVGSVLVAALATTLLLTVGPLSRSSESSQPAPAAATQPASIPPPHEPPSASSSPVAVGSAAPDHTAPPESPPPDAATGSASPERAPAADATAAADAKAKQAARIKAETAAKLKAALKDAAAKAPIVTAVPPNPESKPDPDAKVDRSKKLVGPKLTTP